MYNSTMKWFSLLVIILSFASKISLAGLVSESLGKHEESSTVKAAVSFSLNFQLDEKRGYLFYFFCHCSNVFIFKLINLFVVFSVLHIEYKIQNFSMIFRSKCFSHATQITHEQ